LPILKPLKTSSDAGWDLHALIDEAPIGRAQVLVLCICLLLNIVDGFDVLAMSFAAPVLAEDWSLSADRLGLVFSAGVLGMTLGAMFLAPWTDRLGRRTVIFWAVLVMGVSMLLTAYVVNMAQMICLRIVTGLTIGTMLASLTSVVSEFFPDRLRNIAVGIMLSGYPAGAVMGGFLAAWLLPTYGWPGVFIVGGVMTLALVPLIYWLLPESLHFLVQRRPQGALIKLNGVLGKLRLAPVIELPPAAAIPEAASVRSLLAVQRRESTLLLWTGFFLCFGTLYFLLSWIPKLLVDSGLPLEHAIYAGIAFNVGGALGNLGVGWLSGKLGVQRAMLLFQLIAAMGMVLFATLTLELRFLLALTMIIGFFQQGGFVALYMIAARIYPAEIRTTGVGWGIGLGRFGAVLAPYAAGSLIAIGWGMSILFLMFAVPLVVGGLFVYAIRSNSLPR
jgi:AAHS family 4-hydroxybenzoate transporter-like MFS transporter